MYIAAVNAEPIEDIEQQRLIYADGFEPARWHCDGCGKETIVWQGFTWILPVLGEPPCNDGWVSVSVLPPAWGAPAARWHFCGTDCFRAFDRW